MTAEKIETYWRGSLVVLRILPDGRIAAVRKNLFGASIIVGVDEFGCDDSFDYQAVEQAIAELYLWRPREQPEPAGWIRHMPSGRRRPGGDPKLETTPTD
jgi:hypothetical protein